MRNRVVIEKGISMNYWSYVDGMRTAWRHDGCVDRQGLKGSPDLCQRIIKQGDVTLLQGFRQFG